MRKLFDKKSIIWWGLSIIFFIYFLVMNLDTPLFDDDLYVSSHQTFVSLYNQAHADYFGWNGRAVGQTLWRLLIASQGIGASLAIAVVSVGLFWLIGKFAKNSSTKNWAILLLSFSSVMAFAPVIGQTMFWRAGAGNYLMTTVLILLFILPFYQWYHKKISFSSNWWYLLPVFAFIAGWSNENTAGGGLLAVLLYLVLGKYWKQLKWAVSQALSVIGFIIGYAFLVLAPGNSARTHAQMPAWWFDQSTFTHFKTGFKEVTKSLYHGYLALLLLLLVLTVLVILYKGWAKVIESTLFTIAGLATIYVLSFAPMGQDGGRSFFGGSIFLIIALVRLLATLFEGKQVKTRYIAGAFAFCIIALGLYRVAVGTVDAHKSNQAIRERYEVLDSKKSSREVVKVPKLSYYPQKKFAVDYQLEELSSNQTDIFPNTGYNVHFDLQGILLK
ncbi:DUF3329 domain-containing protein [Fructobacillus durionis]|uniref:Glucosyl transferase GtrII n=1 Tax=Fructobacillus durionis TaxID=283737 RepID=A0A1I1E377_9LACO|nr:DUF6056 family protein [Fructobacillus durionis]SFB81564.1 hypothetical protein SAMN05660453_0270 [Fructobacillus durionis]